MNTVASATPATPAQSQVQPPKAITKTPTPSADDGYPVAHVRHCDPLRQYDSKASKESSEQTQGTSLASSTAKFAKTAKAQGWAAPTATRPSFGC
ncbi:hypothetical protein C8Q74DRAFT_1368102 [Fomes fomentarius]|nr:hypothetical protein C8Q74DRAFT_1368102 [Fomes fomentarius]